jgi:hypothetical protein
MGLCSNIPNSQRAPPPPATIAVRLLCRGGSSSGARLADAGSLHVGVRARGAGLAGRVVGGTLAVGEGARRTLDAVRDVIIASGVQESALV